MLKSSQLEGESYSKAVTTSSKAQLETVISSSDEFQWSEIVEGFTRDITAGVFDCEPTLNRLREGDLPKSSTEISETLELIKDAEAQLSKLDECVGQIQKNQDEREMCFEHTPGLAPSVHPPEDGAARATVQYDSLEQSCSKFIDAGDELKRFIKVMTAFISSPVRHLPEDVLLEIFKAYIASGEIKLRYHSQSWPYSLALIPERGLIHCPTLRLSQICSLWRRIVLSRPILWQSLAVQLEAFVDDGYFEMLSHHLLHSASLPLTLFIKSTPIDSYGMMMTTTYGSEYSIPKQAFNLLLDNSSRWKEVVLELGSETNILLSLGLIRGAEFSNMKHLDLRYQISEEVFIQMLIRMPNLHTLVGATFDWENFSQCDLSQLIELRSAGFYGTSLGLFLSRMPGLKECYLERFRFQPIGTLLQGDCHSNLSTLSLNLDGFDYKPGGWKNTCMPHLKTLDLLAHDGTRGRWLEHNSIIIADLSSMVLLSRATLQRLKLQGVPSQDAIAFIESHPSIADLTISGGFRKDNYWEKYGALFACLTVTEKEQTIDSIRLQVIGLNISSLTLELEVEEVTPESAFVEDVCNLVESRVSLIPDSSNIARLEFVKLQPPRSQDYTVRRTFWAIHTRLAPFREFGLALVLILPEVRI
ncbi:hypothetical protein BDP27DRAFT_1334317 [Rhodocollybia butyracea]|uniref:F-box domain-containing protein n=1 Tax=Rhodocollybia butyracea TaxID=206335 RepID=A0A9P5U3Q9_9AGAR|nr:hypothetical protein BDP27DRAFT_1334317 [Rhodocollybia butyracea]